LLYLRDGPTQRWVFERTVARRAPERVAVAVAGPLKVNNSEVLRDAVLAGLGVGLLPDFSARADLAAGRLQVLLPAWRPVGFFGDRIYATRPWAARVPRPVALLVEHLRNGLAGGFG
jgi:DNA-binding transcriptional LysR family regulator